MYSPAGANILIPGVVILSKAVTLLKDAVIFSTRATAQSNAPSLQTRLAGAELMRGQARNGVAATRDVMEARLGVYIPDVC